MKKEFVQLFSGIFRNKIFYQFKIFLNFSQINFFLTFVAGTRDFSDVPKWRTSQKFLESVVFTKVEPIDKDDQLLCL